MFWDVDPPREVTIDGIRLVMTCRACPEQYDAFDENGTKVGYLRTRWGEYIVCCPDHCGEVVHKDDIDDFGEFDPDKRSFYLNQAVKAIKNWINKNEAFI